MKILWPVFIVGLVAVLLGTVIYEKNHSSLLSTSPGSPQVNDQKVRGSSGAVPEKPLALPEGFSIHVFADRLGGPRDLVFSPGGTLLVSDPASGQVYALPDPTKAGVAASRQVIIGNEQHPHGLAFYGGYLYVAEPNQVVRFSWNESTLTATKDRVLFALPENSNHNNRTLAFDASGKMFVSVGSTCNVCREASLLSGTVVLSDAQGRNPTVFAKGLRNAAFISINPHTGELWGTEMGRDYLGDNAPSDEINIIRQDSDYGWPYCYGNKQHDDDFDPLGKFSCAHTSAPIYEIPPHSAPLGLVFINSPQFPPDWQGDLLVAYHGSWNRSEPAGYKVVHLTVKGNAVTDSRDFLTGFLPPGAVNGAVESYGRPVDLIFDSRGNLYLSDDKSGSIYIIQKI